MSQLRAGERQPAVLVLAVEREQRLGQLAQVGDRRRAAVDERARAPVGADPAGEHDLLGVGGQALAELAAQLVGQLEDALDVGLRRARADDAGLRAPAEQQVQRVREHGLARAGLARQHVEPGREAQLGPLDQQEVLDAQLGEHRHGVPARARRIGPMRNLAIVTTGAFRVMSRGATLGQAPELRPQPAVERRARQLRERRRVGLEARRRAPRRARSRTPGGRRRETSTASRPRLDTLSASPGATTSARAVSECGAMNETPKPSTPQASTGPPLARL